ncbi:MAG: DUF1343 domain-containing protein, partial [Duncaniella sp.]|nr:DUF1343 domain-containing protein [Duncaniella sp.]
MTAMSCSNRSSDTTIGHNADPTVIPATVQTVVKPGIEVLRDNGFRQLAGKRVGLITNPTGIDNDMRSTIDILAEAPDVKLTALFAPEHGVRGNHVAGASIANDVDKKTGIPVYSLHG